MSVGMLLLIILGLALVVAGGIVVASYLSPANRDYRGELQEARAEALAAKQREKIGNKALRAIANGAGNPILEAQDALDAQERTYTKELS